MLVTYLTPLESASTFHWVNLGGATFWITFRLFYRSRDTPWLALQRPARQLPGMGGRCAMTSPRRRRRSRAWPWGSSPSCRRGPRRHERGQRDVPGGRRRPPGRPPPPRRLEWSRKWNLRRRSAVRSAHRHRVGAFSVLWIHFRGRCDREFTSVVGSGYLKTDAVSDELLYSESCLGWCRHWTFCYSLSGKIIVLQLSP